MGRDTNEIVENSKNKTSKSIREKKRQRNGKESFFFFLSSCFLLLVLSLKFLILLFFACFSNNSIFFFFFFFFYHFHFEEDLPFSTLKVPPPPFLNFISFFFHFIFLFIYFIFLFIPVSHSSPFSSSTVDTSYISKKKALFRLFFVVFVSQILIGPR